MDKEAVFSADFKRYLTNGFNKWLRLNIADRSADFSNNHIGICFLTYAVDKFFDFICNMRNDLHRGAKIFTTAFLIKHIPVDLTGGEVGIFVEVFINKAFVMSKVKVGFGTILGNIYFAVLVGTHGTGVNVNIRIQLLCGNLESTCF